MLIFEKLIRTLSRWLHWIALFGLLGIMFLAVANMFSRVPFDPIFGTFEVVGYLGALITAFALVETQLSKGHVSVRLLTARLSPQTQVFLDTITTFVAMGVFGLITRQTFIFATGMWGEGRLSDSLHIIIGPIIYITTIGCGALTLVLLLDFVKSLTRSIEVLKKKWTR